jgi:serine/threonine-protein kinase HipA
MTLAEGNGYHAACAKGLFGIETAAFGLVRLESGALAYLTRRMDREDGMKHMIDFCQLTNRPSERKYYGSYEQICKGIKACSSVVGTDVVRFFEVLLYSIPHERPTD